MKQLIVICLAALLTLPACSEDDTATSPGGEFDTNLIGYWYRFSDPAPGWPTRPRNHYVFYISPDGLCQTGGVETATGKIALLPQNREIRIHFANAGRIGLTWFYLPGVGGDTLDYQVDLQVLSVSGYTPLSGVWTRKQRGQRVTEPILSQFSCRIDGVEANVSPVVVGLGAWISLDSSFVLNAIIENKYGSPFVRIALPDFIGPGSYSLANGKAEFYISSGDMVTAFVSDSLYSGTITIESLDSQSKRCSGSFEFTVREAFGTSNPPQLVTFTHGRFSVPTYP
jgi:hypothetical protein